MEKEKKEIKNPSKKLSKSHLQFMDMMANISGAEREHMISMMKMAYDSAEPLIIKDIVKAKIMKKDELKKMMPDFDDETGNSLVMYLDSVKMKREDIRKDKMVFVTVNPKLMTNKKMLESRFGVLIQTPQQVLDRFKKESPKEWKEFEEDRKKEKKEDDDTKRYIG